MTRAGLFMMRALHGSSHYDLPGVLRWFTANIGVPTFTHLCSRIPYYRLPRVLRDHPSYCRRAAYALQSLSACTGFFWDEREQRLISFREMRIPRR